MNARTAPDTFSRLAISRDLHHTGRQKREEEVAFERRGAVLLLEKRLEGRPPTIDAPVAHLNGHVRLFKGEK